MLMIRFFLFFILLSSTASAVDQTPFPQTPDKKGLSVQMVPDAISLGIHHATVNVSLGALMTSPKNGAPAINANYARSIESQVKSLSDAGVVVYLILLAYPTHDAAKDALLLHPKAKADQKYTIAAFNSDTPEGIANYRRLVAFLAERFSGAHPEAGRAWGYIIGNEVNSQWLWYNLDRMSIISDQEAYRGRDFLDAFAKLARERGDFEWHVAHHPYADNLGNPRTWLDKDAWPTDDSPHITFKNLEVACRHMQQPELLWQGAPRRIILSEQGIHCLATPDGETLQSAGFAYAWEKIARQPLIDAFIWHRHVDHAKEGGLRVGLWTFKPGTISEPDRKRPLYDLFRKAGTPEWPQAAAFALPIVGLKNWDELAK